ncbi:MAG: hypothetical protein WC483_00055 [Candidatus Paceibacterota bacterium]
MASALLAFASACIERVGSESPAGIVASDPNLLLSIAELVHPRPLLHIINADSPDVVVSFDLDDGIVRRMPLAPPIDEGSEMCCDGEGGFFFTCCDRVGMLPCIKAISASGESRILTDAAEVRILYESHRKEDISYTIGFPCKRLWKRGSKLYYLCDSPNEHPPILATFDIEKMTWDDPVERICIPLERDAIVATYVKVMAMSDRFVVTEEEEAYSYATRKVVYEIERAAAGTGLVLHKVSSPGGHSAATVAFSDDGKVIWFVHLEATDLSARHQRGKGYRFYAYDVEKRDATRRRIPLR